MKQAETIKLAKLEQQMSDHTEDNKSDFEIVKQSLIRIETKLDTKTDKTEFNFWRGILVSGILLAILLGVISLLLERFLGG